MNPKALVDRVRRLLLHPQEMLPATLADSGELKALLPWVLVLTAIGPVVGFLSTGLIGYYQPSTVIFNTTVPGMFVRMPGLALVGAVLRFAVGVGGFYGYARVLGWLAPTFGGRNDLAGSLKTSAYTLTPIWLAGGLALFNSIPYLGWLVYVGNLAALGYSAFLGMKAVPLHLGTPEPKALGHVLASIGITVVAVAILYWLLTFLLVSIMLR
jgi:hypothetical protein